MATNRIHFLHYGKYSKGIQMNKCLHVYYNASTKSVNIEKRYNESYLFLNIMCDLEFKEIATHNLQALSVLPNIKIVDILPDNHRIFPYEKVTAHKVSQLPLNICSSIQNATHVLVNEKTIRCSLHKISVFMSGNNFIFAYGLSKEVSIGESILDVLPIIEKKLPSYSVNTQDLREYIFQRNTYMLSSIDEFKDVTFSLACRSSVKLITEESLIRHNSFSSLSEEILSSLYELACSKDKETKSYCLKVLSNYDYLSYPMVCRQIIREANSRENVVTTTAVILMRKLLSIPGRRWRKDEKLLWRKIRKQ